MTNEISRLIDENRVKIIGVIRQEVLSGYSDFQSYKELRDKRNLHTDIICNLARELCR